MRHHCDTAFRLFAIFAIFMTVEVAHAEETKLQTSQQVVTSCITSAKAIFKALANSDSPEFAMPDEEKQAILTLLNSLKTNTRLAENLANYFTDDELEVTQHICNSSAVQSIIGKVIFYSVTGEEGWINGWGQVAEEIGDVIGKAEQEVVESPTPTPLPEPTPTPSSLNGYRPRCPYNIQETLSRLNRAYDQLLYESSSWVTDKTTADLAAALIIGKEIINNDNCRKNDELRDRIRTIEIEIRQRTLDNLSH